MFTPKKHGNPAATKHPQRSSSGKKAPKRSPNKKPSREYSEKLAHLRNIKDILTSKKEELERGSFISKANSFQAWMYDLVKKVTKDNTIPKKYSLLPDLEFDTNSTAEQKLIAKIVRLQYEISFLSDPYVPEYIVDTHLFLAKTKVELENLCASAIEKDDALENLKKEQQRLLDKETARIRKAGAVQNLTSQAASGAAVAMRPRPAILFSAADLQKVKVKSIEESKESQPSKALDQKSLISDAGTVRAIINNYQGCPMLEIPIDQQFKSTIDAYLSEASRDENCLFTIEDALKDTKFKPKIFSIYFEHLERKPIRAKLPDKPNLKSDAPDDPDTKLTASFVFLAKCGITFNPVVNTELLDQTHRHLLFQTQLIKEDAMKKQQDLSAHLVGVDSKIAAAKAELERIKRTLKEEHMIREEASGKVNSVSLETLEATIDAKLSEAIDAKLALLHATLNGLTSTTVGGMVGTPPMTPQYTAAKSTIKPQLSEVTTKFLVDHGFSADKDKLDLCTSKKFVRYTPLTLAAVRINTVVIEALINDGASVNATNTIGNTPLHMLSFFTPNANNSSLEVIKLIDYLISKGADLSLINSEGKTPRETSKDPKIMEKLTPKVMSNTKMFVA